jgi:hypothetical protein
MHGVDARLVLACERRVEFEDEAVVLVLRITFGGNVRARLVSEAVRRELAVNVKLHLDHAFGLSAVNDPAAHALRVGAVERAAEERVEGDGVRVDGERGDEEQVERELRDDEGRQTPARRGREGGGARRKRNTETGLFAFGLRARLLRLRGVSHCPRYAFEFES